MGAIGGSGVSIEEALPLDGSQSMTGPLNLTISDTDNVVGLTVNQNDTTNNPIAATIVNAGTGNALFIDQNGNGSALEIDSESTTANVITADNATTTTGRVLSLTGADSLTTGNIIRAVSDSSNTTFRDLVLFHNTNTLATGATVLVVRQDAAVQCMVLDQNAASSFIDYQGTAAANATDPISTLTTSGATTNHIQIEINGVKAWIAVSTTDPS